MPPKTTKVGAPSKKVPEAVRHALEVAESGLPLRFVAAAANISTETLLQWRRNDEKFDRDLETARLVGVKKKWDAITAAAEANPSNSWAALSWQLERSFPDSFSRPEIQLNQINTSSTTVNNTLVISAEVAEKFAKRNAAIDRELAEVEKEYLARRGQTNGAGRDPVRKVEAELMSSGTITLPPGEISRHPNWWAQLSRGDGHRPITAQAATFIIKTVAADTLGAQRANCVRLDLGEGDITLADVWNALAGLPGGWEALCQKGETADADHGQV